MRRQHGEGSVHPRPNGTWCGQIDLGYVDGKRRRRTVYGKTQPEVVKKMRLARRQLEDHGDLPTSDITVEKWLTYWLNNVAARKLKPGAWRSYRTSVARHIIPAIGKKRLSKLSVENIDQMHAYIIDTLELSPTTAVNAHRVLSVALNEAVRRNRVGRNIAHIVSPPSKEEPTRTGLTAAEAIKVLQVAGQDERLGSRWLAAFLTGVRQGERLGLRWSSVNFDTGIIDLSWALQSVSYRHGCVPLGTDPTCGKKRGASCSRRELAIPKGMAHQQLKGTLVLLRPKTKGSIRVVAMIEPLRVALEMRRAQVEAERPGYVVDHDLVWCETDGSPIDPKDDWQAWVDLLAAAKVRRVTGHETRHTTATLLLEAGVAAKVIEEILGHSTAAVTKGYQHVSAAVQRDALGLLGARLELT